MNLFQEMTHRIVNLVHPAKVLYLPRDENLYADKDLLFVVMSRLGRGNTPGRYATRIYADMSNYENYPDRGVDILVDTVGNMEKRKENDDSFYRLLATKGNVLYERSGEDKFGLQ